jgi:hypothetical protein
MTDNEYDAIGVVLTQDGRGRFCSQRIFINKDKVVLRENLTSGRVASWAVKEARESLNRLISDWMRGKVSFSQPDRLTFTLEER